jgi:hypothetical protein
MLGSRWLVVCHSRHSVRQLIADMVSYVSRPNPSSQQQKHTDHGSANVNAERLHSRLHKHRLVGCCPGRNRKRALHAFDRTQHTQTTDTSAASSLSPRRCCSLDTRSSSWFLGAAATLHCICIRTASRPKEPRKVRYESRDPLTSVYVRSATEAFSGHRLLSKSETSCPVP